MAWPDTRADSDVWGNVIAVADPVIRDALLATFLLIRWR